MVTDSMQSHATPLVEKVLMIAIGYEPYIRVLDGILHINTPIILFYFCPSISTECL